jgi:hypothetical protein
LTEVVALGRDTIIPVSVTTAAALVLLPAPRVVAWTALLLVATAIGWRAGSAPGVVSAVTACFSYLFAHGRPRFASTISDPVTIRAGFVLGILGAVCAVAADWRARTAHPATGMAGGRLTRRE